MKRTMSSFHKAAMASILAFAGCAQFGTEIPDVTVTPPAPDGVVRRAVVFGLDHVDPAAYGGWAGACPGTVLVDATKMRALLISRGYSTVLLVNEQATALRVTAACVAAAQGMKTGDRLYVYGSSHGGQAPDINGDEAGGQDSTICLWDGQFTDDLVWKMLLKVPDGVEVDITLDCCNTGTMYKAPRDYARVFRASNRSTGGTVLACSVWYMGGCGDGESSYGSVDGGEFTNALRANGPGSLTRRQWFTKAKAVMPRNQVPVCAELGAPIGDKEAMR